LIAFLSSVFTLEPGDIVSTGTPAGVGVARKPPRFLQPGDDVAVKIPAIGELRNPVVAET
jgi:2-keto-4-pentenoate hydratase/2-oxohepta-3-ene-1,7-dioic acid hydratase in catechol pathway